MPQAIEAFQALRDTAGKRYKPACKHVGLESSLRTAPSLHSTSSTSYSSLTIRFSPASPVRVEEEYLLFDFVTHFKNSNIKILKFFPVNNLRPTWLSRFAWLCASISASPGSGVAGARRRESWTGLTGSKRRRRKRRTNKWTDVEFNECAASKLQFLITWQTLNAQKIFQ